MSRGYHHPTLLFLPYGPRRERQAIARHVFRDSDAGLPTQSLTFANGDLQSKFICLPPSTPLSDVVFVVDLISHCLYVGRATP